MQQQQQRYRVHVIRGLRGGFGWVEDTRTGQHVSTSTSIENGEAVERILRSKCEELNLRDQAPVAAPRTVAEFVRYVVDLITGAK